MKVDDLGTIIINKQKDEVKMLKKEIEITTDNGVKFKLPYNKIKKQV